MTFEVVDGRGNPAAMPPHVKLAEAGNGQGGVRNLVAGANVASSGYQLDLDGVQIVLRANANGNDLKSFYESQFKAADGDNNKYLEKKEADSSYPFNTLFEVLDRDKDGKVFLEEVVAFADRQQDASRSRTTVIATDRGRALFEAIDLNRDLRLSPRELRQAAALLLPADRDGDGQVALSEIHRQYIVAIGRGATGFPYGENVVFVESAPNTAGQPAAGAPSWFNKMDRNHDGDVSRREFLGPRAEFDRMDLDHDGLLDAKEAAN